jgi:cell division protein ZapA
MGTVNVLVNGRPYTVGCEDGQEAHVEALARGFDRQVQAVGAQVGQVGDLRLFLMAALLGADELEDVRARMAQLQAQLTARQSEHADLRRRAAEAVDGAARRVEQLAAKLE